MTETERTPADERDLRRFWTLVVLAGAATLVAAMAGMVLGIAEPGDGSTWDGVLRATAAGAGLAAGAFFGAAAIWAQVKNLWRFAPQWFRYLAWGVLAAVVIVAMVSSAARTA